MRRESHVRFCEGGGVRLPSATRHVICCRGTAEQAMTEMRRLMTQLKLTINEAKTDIRQLPQERFDFLGYSFGRYYSSKTGQAYLCAQPSRKSVKRMIGKIREATERKMLGLRPEDVVKRLNRMLIGWANYFSLAQLSQLGEKSLQYQWAHVESLHYTTLAGARAVFSGAGAVMRGRGCGGRSSLSWWTSIFCSAVSSV
jgi:hypothetical protein